MTSALFLEFLVSISIQAILIVGMTSWMCRFVEAPRRQCRLWNTCNVLLLLVVFCGVLLPHLRTPVPWQQLSPRIFEHVVVTESIVGQSVLMIWILGMSVSILLYIREWMRAFHFLKSCRHATEQETALLTQVDHSLLHHKFSRTTPSVQLLISSQLASPFCCQWHVPQIVIPEFLLKLPSDQIKMIVQHEREHLRSGHPLQLFIERLVVSAFWFHPAIWWAAQQFSLAREYACDDAAISQQQETVNYLKALVAVAERGLSEEAEGAALFFGRDASVVALRGRRLINKAEVTPLPDISNQMRWTQLILTVLALAVSFIWVPLDALASSRTNWSPWPQWSAKVLRTFDIPARDFEPYEIRTRLHEISASSRLKQDPLPPE